MQKRVCCKLDEVVSVWASYLGSHNLAMYKLAALPLESFRCYTAVVCFSLITFRHSKQLLRKGWSKPDLLRFSVPKCGACKCGDCGSRLLQNCGLLKSFSV